jgi:anaerobic magnesium-protoporphyrin IX monomethyl ester cyclase
MPIDILLTYPSDGLRLFQSMVPTGLVGIGTVLRRAGYEVRIIDFNHYSRDFRRDLQKWRPRVIGIGGTTPSRMGSFYTARLVKETLPDTIVVYGGINATFTSAEVIAKIPSVDYILQGEGEFSFLALCDAIFGKSLQPVAAIPGICMRGVGGIIQTKPERINDLSLLPIPDRDLLPHDYRMEMEFISGRGDFIMTSRGCPAACNFCAASRMFPGGVRYRPLEQVGAEIEALLARRTIAGLKIFDSTFTADREHVLGFCDLIKHFNIPWECEIRADSVDSDLLARMKASGCYYINMGMETANLRHLKHIAKGISSEQVLGVLAWCRQLDIRSKVFFTFGHPGQTLAECREDIRFIEQHRAAIDFFAVTVGMRVYPGTRLEKQISADGLRPKGFSWTRSAKSWKNLFVLEPSDVPVLFQKQLGPHHLALVLGCLFWKRLICTERFLLRMTGENILGVLRFFTRQATYTGHRFRRIVEAITSRREAPSTQERYTALR